MCVCVSSCLRVGVHWGGRVWPHISAECSMCAVCMGRVRRHSMLQRSRLTSCCCPLSSVSCTACCVWPESVDPAKQTMQASLHL